VYKIRKILQELFLQWLVVAALPLQILVRLVIPLPLRASELWMAAIT
jgi:hypothetical protein